MPSSVVVAFFFFQISPVTHISMPIPFIQYPPTAGKVTCRVRLSLQFLFLTAGRVTCRVRLLQFFNFFLTAGKVTCRLRLSLQFFFNFFLTAGKLTCRVRLSLHFFFFPKSLPLIISPFAFQIIGNIRICDIYAQGSILQGPHERHTL
jgi:hypothetical protein